jgi:hypothetical protein
LNVKTESDRRVGLCRPTSDNLPEIETAEFLEEEIFEEQQMEEDGEGYPEPEPEIDPNLDPLQKSGELLPGPEWEKHIRSLKVRTPNFPSPEEQQQRVKQILEILDTEGTEPEPWQVEQAKRWLDELESLIPNHEKYVASSFNHCYAAWKDF